MRSLDKSVNMITLPSPWLIDDKDLPNLGVLGIASYLQQNNIETTVSDLCGLTEDKWDDNLKYADIYGISLTTPQAHLAEKVAQRIRERQPNALIVMGGYHASAMPEHTLNLGADYVVKGDGEVEMLKITRGQLNGLKRGIIDAPMIPEAEMQKLPWPARELIDIDQYHRVGTNANVWGDSRDEIKEGHLITSRGCPFKCGFCAQMTLSNFRVRYREDSDVFNEMRHLGEKYNCNRFYMFDDIFIVSEKQVNRLCNKFDELQKEFSFDWHCLGRVDVPPTFNRKLNLYKRMYDAGCKQITYGIEHADDRILRRIEKETTYEENMEAIIAAKTVGMRVRAQMIVGLPGETDDSIETMARFIRESPVDSVGVHVFVPLPGSPIWDYSDESGYSKKFDFRFRKVKTFEWYQTIGRPGEWASHYLHINPLPEQIQSWAEYIRGVAGEKNAYRFDPRWKEKSKTAQALYVQDVPGSC
ncbi:B12-binding domain-containing radical SAM protein [Candidatus Pacearchaeota archaeon]|nr:B12-binding domain-containing radical SAM protein [Candidatus Pacearchaeota archaeon]